MREARQQRQEIEQREGEKHPDDRDSRPDRRPNPFPS
jgi:hypothetical protein